MNPIIGERYRLGERLGAGGMGVVYRAEDLRLAQTVAVKHLKAEAINSELIERFRREGQSLRDLNHPNIVRMLDAVEEAGQHYLVMEYLPGGDLAGRLRAGRMTPAEAVALALDLADALTRAHRLNIIHRDLKPANVLIAGDGTPRLTDFGVAHQTDLPRLTSADVVVGTLDYLAPELLEGAPVDARVDLWAFGVMLFEILAGERPFKGDSLTALLLAITAGPLPNLEALCPEASPALIDLVYRLLERDPAARIASARHVGAALEDIAIGRETPSGGAGRRFETPAPDHFARPRHNLPAQVTPFVGREAERSELARLLVDPAARLLTLLGPGGMGKTRLALQVAEDALGQFPDGVYLVELAPLSDAEAIVAAIADAVDYPFQSDGRDPKRQILDFLATKALLLVLDNYEHLIEAGAGLAGKILAAAPEVRLLATSRARLGQPGEMLYPLGGIDFPDWETPADALRYAAIQLFVNSARRAQPGFALTTDNMAAVARICRLVGGMPLGIVLAAAWSGMLSPDEIAAEITAAPEFLTTDASELPERQRSLQGVLEYTWRLLSADEAQVFARLSVFRGGFTREAAEAVAGGSLRTLLGLTQKSVIRRDPQSGRYAIHELLRQYAERQLAVAGDADAARAAHLRYFAGFAAQHGVKFYDAGQKAALSALEADLDNLRAAWKTAIDARDAALIAELMAAKLFYESIGLFHEAYQQWRDALAHLNAEIEAETDGVHLARAELRDGISLICLRLDWIDECETEARAALAEFERLGMPSRTLLPLATLYNIALYREDLPQARELMQTLSSRSAVAQNSWFVSVTVNFQAYIAVEEGDLSRAEQLFRQVAEARTTIGDYWGLTYALSGLADTLTRMGKVSAARPIFRRAIDNALSIKQWLMVAFCSSGLAENLIATGDDAEARAVLERALRVAQDMNLPNKSDLAEQLHRLVQRDA